jgi:hypothetical protein
MVRLEVNGWIGVGIGLGSRDCRSGWGGKLKSLEVYETSIIEDVGLGWDVRFIREN